MYQRIHDDEVDSSEPIARRLLRSECPQWSELPLTYLENTGSSNTLWHVHVEEGADVVVRLPRTDGAEVGVLREIGMLPVLASTQLAETFIVPSIVHSAGPSETFPLSWSVLGWIHGEDAWSCRDDPAMAGDEIAHDMASAIELISALEGVPVPRRTPGQRGGPLGPVLDNLDRWLDETRWSASDLIDVSAIRRIADQGRELADGVHDPVFSHGDLLPGNLLVSEGRLTAVIDWAAAAYGDPAHDIGTVWAMLDARQRAIFKERLDVDEETWLRGTVIELEQAVGASLYYRPRNHPLGDVGTRTLRHILEG